jgi:hypothetical protein
LRAVNQGSHPFVTIRGVGVVSKVCEMRQHLLVDYIPSSFEERLFEVMEANLTYKIAYDWIASLGRDE